MIDYPNSGDERLNRKMECPLCAFIFILLIISFVVFVLWWVR